MKRKIIDNSELAQNDHGDVSLPKRSRRNEETFQTQKVTTLKRKRKDNNSDNNNITSSKRKKNIPSVKGEPFALESSTVAAHLVRIGREEKNIPSTIRLKCTINLKKILDGYDLSEFNLYSSSSDAVTATAITSNKLAKNFEELAYISCLREIHQYEHRIKQLCYNLRNNGEFLLKKYSINPDVIAFLEDRQYGEGTASENLIKEHAKRTEKQNALILDARPIIDESHIQDIKDLKHMICNKCGGDDIDWKTAQTRSADEGMTQFFTCRNPKCGTKWKK